METEAAHPTTVHATLEERGFVLLERAVGSGQLSALNSALEAATDSRAAGLRNLLFNSPLIGRLAANELAALFCRVSSTGWFPVRALLFDKTPETNWKVSWHQDLSIAVTDRAEIPGFSGWSLKEGVWHVQPPFEVLERMLTVRLHLDDCGTGQGPLRVLPGSHRHGRLSSADVLRLRRATCAEETRCRAGDALIMRPLLLHASSKATHPSRRRVLHVEYANEALPGGLKWVESKQVPHQRPTESVSETF